MESNAVGKPLETEGEMADSLPTIWAMEKHTLAKHSILKTYLKAWVPIMSRQSQRIGVGRQPLLFVDGFAGPGVYEEWQDGSPILALKAILDHSVELPVPVRFVFIEKDPDRYKNLSDLVDKMRDRINSSQRIHKVEIKPGECEQLLSSMLDDIEKRQEQLGPAFLFLDQFGYSDISMKLIKRIMRQSLCEVFSYLNWDHMNRFISDKDKWPAISNAFGGDEWKEVFKLEQKERAGFMLKAYRDALKTKAGSQYVWHFDMCDSDDTLIYWLFFCTNNLRGLEEMKKSMSNVGQTGGFRFSDKDTPSQLYLFSSYKPETLAEELSSKLRGKILSVYEVKEFVLTETPAYLFKHALKLLEKGRLLEIVNEPADRRKGTFSDEKMQIKFLSGSD